ATDSLQTLGSLWVEGEIFGYRGPYGAAGHHYFKLRDENAQLDVKLWGGSARRALHCELVEGRRVRVYGRFDIWPKRGDLSFILNHVEDAGVGDLARKFEQLRKQLASEGLFDEDRKQPLPVRPRTVAVITAHPSAASADFLETMADSVAPIHLWMVPSRVQGDGAELELVQAIESAVRAQPDCIVLTRGGGSLEDLWAFNEEALVRAVAESPIPVLNAVGHESDTTLCDYAADAFARTPTAAARQLADGWVSAHEIVARCKHRLFQAGQRVGLTERNGLDHLAKDLKAQRPDRRLDRHKNQVGYLQEGIERAMHALLGDQSERVLQQGRALQLAEPKSLRRRFDGRLQALVGRLESGSPLAILGRGFALVEAKGGSGFLRSAEDVAPGDQIQVHLAKGILDATVDEASLNGLHRGE
ncbi:MAG: exodeoxyribonuclease VII large subunit, partial [Planctomycetes bacterium]|nr:exodeoxyribonuclease VII large subunit [Planctomycetota bacterium]